MNLRVWAPSLFLTVTGTKENTVSMTSSHAMMTGFSYCAHLLANVSVTTDRRVETIGHLPALGSGIFNFRK